MESWRGGRWWASRHEPWRNQVKRTVHWKQGKNRVNAEALKKTKNNYKKTSEKKWLRYYLMECRCPLTSAGNWLHPRVSRTQPELRKGEKNKLQIPQHPRLSHSFINVCSAEQHMQKLCSLPQWCAELLYSGRSRTVLAWQTPTAAFRRPLCMAGHAKSSLREKHIYVLYMRSGSQEKSVDHLCFHTFKKNGICIHKIIKWCNEVRFFTKWIDVNIWNAQRPSKRKRSIFCC